MLAISPDTPSQDCFHRGLDPIEWSSEDLPKDLLSQLILKAALAPVLLEMKGLKPELPSCKSGNVALFLWVYAGQGPGEFCGGFDTTSVKTNFLISLLL